MAKFIPGIYNNFYYKILGYFWGVTRKGGEEARAWERSSSRWGFFPLFIPL